MASPGQTAAESLVVRIAREAWARGWLTFEDLWLLAGRMTDGEPVDISALFRGVLSAERLEQLRPGPADGTRSERTVTSATASGEPTRPVRVVIPPNAPSPSLANLATPRARYEIGDELGRGGMGVVYRAIDRETTREVALKTLRSEMGVDRSARQRFVHEARVTAQLEHPSIVPVYDIGVLADGLPFYTMRIVERRSLREVLDERGPHSEWTHVRLCSALVQVCRAVHYAHTRGVIHRDLKPENVLLGRHGEVYVADWGIARVRSDETSPAPPLRPTFPAPDLDDPMSETRAVATRAGAMMGTLGYMAPEQMRGEWESVDGRSDVFSLGAILFEVLTGRLPFDHESPARTLLAALEESPPRPRELWPQCPLVLDDLCMRMLAKARDERPASSREVADDIESWLEGARERARRNEEAERLAAVAREHADRHRSLAAGVEALGDAARSAARDVKPWEPVERKRSVWDLEDRASGARIEQAQALAAAVRTYTQALAYDADSTVVRRGLADLYWSQFLDAEMGRDAAMQQYNETLVRLFDDGRYGALLAAAGSIALETPRAPARVTAYRYREMDRVLRATDPRDLGATPLWDVRLDPGSYLLVISADGFRDVRYPVRLERGQHVAARVNLYTDDEIGEGFVFVPAGTCTLGGDPDALESLPRSTAFVADYAIARFPVTFDEYLAFIDDVDRRGAPESARRLPRSLDANDGDVVFRGPDGRWRPHFEAIIEGEQARQFCPVDRIGQTPVVSVDWFDACAYARWRSARDACAYRLPTEIEFEKAARGVDARRFPWGDAFDATFCKMRDSRPGIAQPEPVGAFETDASPYGVRDLAGGARAWAADVHGELDADAAAKTLEPTEGASRDSAGTRISRGGAWLNTQYLVRSAARGRHFALLRFSGLGIRLARSLSPPPLAGS